MSVSILDFWKLAVASGILSPDRCRQLHANFAGLKGAAQQANLGTLTQWLIAEGVLTRYQAAQLSAGRPGPFLFGRYTIVERIEIGRFTHFFRAQSANAEPALLAFGAYLAGKEDPEELAHQATCAGHVASPHVSRVIELLDTDPLILAVEEPVGHALREHLSAHKKPSLTSVCRVGFQAALGLVAVHASGQTHGGVWPDNLWVDLNGTIKLLQFPLVPIARRVLRRQLPAADYLSPELGAGEQRPSELTDIYALGCTLYQLIAGRVVFEGGSPDEKIERHKTEVPPRLDRLVPGVPEELADVVAEMLAKDPMLRCPSAHEAAHLLSRFVSSTKGRGLSPPRISDGGPVVGYGAWQAPTWEAPPQLPSGIPVASPGAGKPPSDGTRSMPRAPQPVVRGTEPQCDPSRPAAETPIDVKREPLPPRGPHAQADPRNEPAEVILPADDKWKGPIVVTDGAAGNRPRGKQGSKSPILWVSGLVVAVLASGFAIIAALHSDDSSPADSAPAAAATKMGEELPSARGAGDKLEASPAAGAARESAPEVDDDGQTLWAEPTAGAPLSLDYLPSGIQALIALRPNEILASDEGRKLVDALGPAGPAAVTMLQELLGVPVQQIESLSIAFYSTEAGSTQAAFVMRLTDEHPRAQLLAAWGAPIEREHAGKKYWQSSERGYWMPEATDGRVVAVAPIAALHEVLERKGPPLVRAAMERLLRHSDCQRLVTLLWTPSYLQTDGKNLLVGDLSNLGEPLARFFDASIEAVLLSGHFHEQNGGMLFLELRAVAPPDVRPNELTVDLRERLAKLPQRVAVHVGTFAPEPYGQQVLQRFPKMLLLLEQYVRWGVEDRQAVLNAYLPGAAAHNLILATQLALSAPRGTATAGPASRTTAPASAASALERTISLSFPRESLDRCVEQLAGELGIAIEIVGADLQLEGITKNQSLHNLDMREQPASKVLQQVLKLANPEGKLVYVVTPQGAQGALIRITTRAAASKRGEHLPSEFVEKTAPSSP